MKEAPERIYLATTEGVQSLDSSFVGVAHSDPEDIVEPIEYVRKDALYKKIEMWLNNRHKHDRYTLLYLRKHFKEIINGILDD